jgi:hypothetical protein
MDDDAKQQALLSALVTEHFVLQSARGVATSEAGTQASLYLTALTGTLVALGFIAQVGEQFDAVLPALFLLGAFTYVRLLENSIEDVLLQRSINASAATTWHCTPTRPSSSATPPTAPAAKLLPSPVG